MGVYEAFVFPKLYCPYCGKGLTDIQSREYGGSCNYNKIGDTIEPLKYKNEITEVEDYHDCSEEKGEKYGFSFLPFFYIIIKDNIYMGVTPDLRVAKLLMEVLDVDEEDYVINYY